MMIDRTEIIVEVLTSDEYDTVPDWVRLNLTDKEIKRLKWLETLVEDSIDIERIDVYCSDYDFLMTNQDLNPETEYMDAVEDKHYSFCIDYSLLRITKYGFTVIPVCKYSDAAVWSDYFQL